MLGLKFLGVFYLLRVMVGKGWVYIHTAYSVSRINYWKEIALVSWHLSAVQPKPKFSRTRVIVSHLLYAALNRM